QALTQAEKLGDKKEIGHSLRYVATMLYLFKKFNPEKSLDYLERSLAVFEDLGDQEGIGLALNAMGNVHSRQRNTDKALEYYNRFLTIAEALNDKRSIGAALNNISTIYMDKNDNDSSIDYLKRALAISKETGEKASSAGFLQNIGWNYSQKGNYSCSLDYYEGALTIRENLGQKLVASGLRNFIGWGYKDMGEYDKAVKTFEKNMSFDDGRGSISWDLAGIAIVDFNKGEYEAARDNFDRVFAIRKKHDITEFELYLTTYRFLIYKHLGEDFDLPLIQKLIKNSKPEDIYHAGKFSSYEKNFRLY
ncbi:uncharacterized protein METZ01_LOCUS369381, partial [marine metagenome]